MELTLHQYWYISVFIDINLLYYIFTGRILNFLAIPGILSRLFRCIASVFIDYGEGPPDSMLFHHNCFIYPEAEDPFVPTYTYLEDLVERLEEKNRRLAKVILASLLLFAVNFTLACYAVFQP